MKSKSKKQLSSSNLGDRLSMTEWKKHYVSTVTAEEDAWPQREPGTNLGRIFVLLLLLHVFIIGAVVLYNIVSPKAPLATRTDSKQTVKKSLVATSGKTENTSVRAVTPPVVKPTPAAAPPVDVARIEPPPAASKPVDGLLIYDVKSGDNVPGIAAALGVDAQELVRLNSLDKENSELYPGRKLEYRKPSMVTLVAPPSAANPAKVQQAKLTIPTPGKLKTPEPVRTASKVSPDPDSPPKAETKVNVPEASPDAVPHAVPYKPASRTEDQLPPAKKMKNDPNNAPPSKPKTEARAKNDDAKSKKSKSDKPDSSSKTASKTDKNSSGKKTHVVGVHETLYSISRKFGVSVSALQKANGIKDPTLLRDGSKIIIPSKN